MCMDTFQMESCVMGSCINELFTIEKIFSIYKKFLAFTEIFYCCKFSGLWYLLEECASKKVR